MCVIIAKKKGDRLPTIDELKNCFTRNDDGAGFMYNEGGQVVIDKGYMTEASFLKHFQKLCKKHQDFKDEALVIHCRIGTAGSNNEGNTHPYPITNKVKQLHATYFRAPIGIAHNGVIQDYQPRSKNLDQRFDINDTQLFISTFLDSINKHYPTFYKDKNILDAIEKLTSSKFAILTASGEVVKIGNFVEVDGLAFSNESYKQPTYIYTPASYYYDNYHYYNGWDDWSDYKHEEDLHQDEELFDEDNFDARERATYNINELVDIPEDYYLEYNNEEHFTSEGYYLIDLSSGWLYKYDDDASDYILEAKDFNLYDKDFELVKDFEACLY